MNETQKSKAQQVRHGIMNCTAPRVQEYHNMILDVMKMRHRVETLEEGTTVTVKLFIAKDPSGGVYIHPETKEGKEYKTEEFKILEERLKIDNLTEYEVKKIDESFKNEDGFLSKTDLLGDGGYKKIEITIHL